MALSSLSSCSSVVSAALVHRTGCFNQECSQLAPVGETPNMASSAAATEPSLELKLEEGCMEEPSSPGESDEDEAAVVRHGERWSFAGKRAYWKQLLAESGSRDGPRGGAQGGTVV